MGVDCRTIYNKSYKFLTTLTILRFRHAVLSSMMGSKRVTPKIITSAQSRPSKLAPKIATLVEVLREARRKETELARLSKFDYFHINAK